MMPQDPESIRRVFVYGTLRSGGSNDIRRFRPAPRYVAPARIEGLLYDLGPYPGARLGGAGWIEGEVFEIDPELELQLDVLEEVDGEQGEYVKRDVWIDIDHQRVRCLVYEVHRTRIEGRRTINGGDWMAHVS